jgi:hypothetical protein
MVFCFMQALRDGTLSWTHDVVTITFLESSLQASESMNVASSEKMFSLLYVAC